MALAGPGPRPASPGLALAALLGGLKDPQEMKEAVLKSGSSEVLDQHLRHFLFFLGHKQSLLKIELSFI